MTLYIQDLTMEANFMENAAPDFHAVADCLEDSFFLIDRDYRLLAFNRSFSELMYHATDSMARIGDCILPEKQNSGFICDCHDYFLKAFAGEKVRGEISCMVGSRVYHFMISLHPLEGPSQVNSVCCFLKDITQSKKILEEEKLQQSIISSSEDAILSLTLDGKITSWNKGAEKMFQYKKYEVLGRKIMELLPKRLKDEEFHILKKIASGKRIKHYETIRKRKDGTLIDVSLSVSPIKNDRGTIIGASKIARDISEKKKSETELLILNEQLRRFSAYIRALQEKERKSLAQGTLEEIAQQMAVLNMEVSFLQSQLGGTELEKNISQVSSAIKQVIQLVQDKKKDIRPDILDDFGLIPAIDWLKNEFERNYNICCKFINNTEGMRYGAELETLIFRFIKELLEDIGKIKKSSEVQIVLVEDNGELLVKVSGDGNDVYGAFQRDFPVLLISMQESVREIKGSVNFRNHRNDAFSFEINIPL